MKLLSQILGTMLGVFVITVVLYVSITLGIDFSRWVLAWLN